MEMDAAEFAAVGRLAETVTRMQADLSSEFGITAEIHADHSGLPYLSVPTMHNEAVEAHYSDEDGSPEWGVSIIRWDMSGGITSDEDRGAYAEGWPVISEMARAVTYRESYWARLEQEMEGAE